MRNPYVGEGADGARRSAAIDRSEADGLDPGPYRDTVLASAAAWEEQAELLEAAGQRPPHRRWRGRFYRDDSRGWQVADAEVLEGEVVDYPVEDAEVVLSARDQAAQRLVAIAALEQLVRKLKAEHREQAASVYDRPHMKDPVMLAGRELGQARTDAVKGGWKVKDAGKWLAYVTKTDPGAVVEVTTAAVDPTWQARVLADLNNGTEGPWLDLDTGEELDSPPAAAGLEYTPPGHKLVVVAAKDAAAQVTHLLGPAARQLGLPELEADR